MRLRIQHAEVLLGILVAVPLALLAAERDSVALPQDSFSPGAGPATKLPGMLAVALTPRNFPKHSPADTAAMFQTGAELGSGAVFIYQWSDPNLAALPRVMKNYCAENKLTPIFALSPTTVDKVRKEIDAPAALRTEKLSFADPDVKAAFIHSAEELAKLEPPYLCLATEINFYALNGPDAYIRFAALYKEAYRAVKKVSPTTKVFVSFQFDFMRLLDNKEPGKISEHVKLLDIFRPELDLVAITTYPAEFYADPAKLPANYYSYLRKYLHPDDSVMVMEVGWPTHTADQNDLQKAFVKRLPELFAEISPRVTAWSMLHDVGTGVFGPNLATTGLYTNDGKPKPAVAEWKALQGW